MSIYEFLSERYVLPKKVRLFEAFAGIGCQHMAFNRLGIEVEVVGISEIDKYAIASYNAIHGQTKNFGSICDIKGQDLPEIDVFTWSFPCTDLSKAGKQKGLTNTRSGLVYEVLRILHEATNKPKVLIMENVVDLVQSKFIREFNEIQAELERLGYENHTQTMNAKDYGVAQNRDRVFMVSILGGGYYEFPKPFKLEKRLKDYLEYKVEERYYLSDVALSGITNALERNGKTLDGEIGQEELSVIQYPRGENAGGLISNITSPTIDGAIGARNTALLCIKEKVYEGVVDEKYYLSEKALNWIKTSKYECNTRVNDVNGVAACVDTMGGGNREPKIYEPVCLNSKVNGKQPSLQDRVYDSEAIATEGTTGFMPSVTVIGNYSPSGHNASRIVDDSGLAPAVKENHGTVTAIATGFMPSVTEPNENNRFYYQAIKTMNENEVSYGDTISAFNMTVDKSGCSPTITTRPEGLKTAILPITHDVRIRKLTPRECWRLMGIDDSDFDKASQVCSNSQLYKQAGNGIVVDVFAEILKAMVGK